MSLLSFTFMILRHAQRIDTKGARSTSDIRKHWLRLGPNVKRVKWQQISPSTLRLPWLNEQSQEAQFAPYAAAVTARAGRSACGTTSTNAKLHRNVSKRSASELIPLQSSSNMSEVWSQQYQYCVDTNSFLKMPCRASSGRNRSRDDASSTPNAVMRIWSER